jgi:hypothetical protein
MSLTQQWLQDPLQCLGIRQMPLTIKGLDSHNHVAISLLQRDDLLGQHKG